MPPLLVGMVLLWYALGYRFAVLRHTSSKENARLLIDEYYEKKWSKPDNMMEHIIVEAIQLKNRGVHPVRRYLDDLIWDFEKEMDRFQVLIRTIVTIAPLLGLLGTVGGMIETFDSLQEMALFTQSGGIAAGISQALITTQFGLAVAIPGLLVNQYLLRRKNIISLELALIKDILSARQTTGSSDYAL